MSATRDSTFPVSNKSLWQGWRSQISLCVKVCARAVKDMTPSLWKSPRAHDTTAHHVWLKLSGGQRSSGRLHSLSHTCWVIIISVVVILQQSAVPIFLGRHFQGSPWGNISFFRTLEMYLNCFDNMFSLWKIRWLITSFQFVENIWSSNTIFTSSKWLFCIFMSL